jgi:hypothetical protein
MILLKTLVGISLATIFAVSLLVINPAIALPNNANENAQVRIPEHAKEIAPGIFYLGKSISPEGKIVEGIMAFHHKPNHNGGSKGGDETTVSNCYSLYAKGAKWKEIEPWIVNPTNVNSLTDNVVLTTISSSIDKWETASGSNFMGTGSTTEAALSIDTQSMDGQNEVYFGSIAEPGAIAVTITWGTFSGPPPFRELNEWDMVYDEDDFEWSANGEAGKMDFENIVMHELGHAMGLGHPGDSCTEETMYRFANNGETKKQDLHDGDITGINQLY